MNEAAPTGGSEDERIHSYWADRDKLDWSHMPKIFDKECKPFY